MEVRRASALLAPLWMVLVWFACAGNEGASESSLRDLVSRLGDSDQMVRDEAARRLRTLDHDAIAGSRRSVHETKLKKLAYGMSRSDLEAATGAIAGLTHGGGGAITVIYRLDDYWSFAAVFDDESGELFELVAPERAPRPVWVEPPAEYTGRWRVYFIDGTLLDDFEYRNGERLEAGSDGEGGEPAAVVSN